MKKKIVVGVDDSPRALAVLTWALEHADPTDKVIALSVWNLGLAGGFENPFSDLNAAQVQATVRVNSLIERVTRGRWDGQQPGVTVTAEVRHGDTASELASATEDADLLVLGNCHYDRPGRLGSVAKSVLFSAKCAVVLVPVNTAASAEPDSDRWSEDSGLVDTK